ncbi:thioredoxin domain-containing protein [Brevundimonas sp.]|uniref:thioredoxin domain-containing protein n=1 Tax=Brevundimonas sp. TaxID=1871086 RepID=UPI0017AE3D47|nr:thioredoxin domain-containing protein [Brevundimonas sp.]MBA3050301.1 DsbA family protein [Brevundimonas sp.]MBU3971762.1 DsbA family protein [Alphaproteobacteria bacterium]MBU4039573.1 DsbA family protein [Alphaproteobacteria bacterium]MBU4137882.1 DsbA family protein [Alphaproteobacteria bacterium]
MIIRPLLVAFGLMAFVAPPAWAQTAPEQARAALAVVQAQDRVLGRFDAPITVIEYASFTCPHCATWHQTVLPAFKARFIDSGQVRLVFRDLPTAPQGLSVPAAAMARCAAPEAYFEVAQALMDGQAALRAGGDPNAWMSRAAQTARRPVTELQACMNDAATQSALNAGVEAAVAGGVTGTPMFLVNGRLVEDSSLEGLARAIDDIPPTVE